MCIDCGCSTQAQPDQHQHEPRTIRIEEDLLAKNNRLAVGNRKLFAAKQLLVLNLVSSPGSGKTSSLERTLSRECPYCHGSGRIKALTTVCLEIRRELLAVADGDIGQQVSLTVHPAISHYLQGPFRELMRELEEIHGLPIILCENPLFHEEQFEISE